MKITKFSVLLVFLVLILSPWNVLAHPYASGITNQGGTISWVLNESATDVQIIYDSGAITNDLGSSPAVGTNTFALGAHTNFAISVYKIGSNAVTQISSDANINNGFFGPRGVAVNRNPQTWNFGRVYIANASAGNPHTAGFSSRTNSTRGIYTMDAASGDYLHLGNTAATAGITLGTSTTYSPYKIFVGPDDVLYVADNSAGTIGGVWMVAPNLAASTNLFPLGNPSANTVSSGLNYGRAVGTPFVTGSYASGTLSLIVAMGDLNLVNPPGTYGPASPTVYNQLYQYNIGGGALPWNNFPTVITNPIAIGNINTVVIDSYIAPDGKYFITADRGSPTDGTTNFCVLNSAGSQVLWDSKTQSLSHFGDAARDHLCQSDYGVAVSPDDKYVVIQGATNNTFLLMALTNGVPDISTLTTNTSNGGTTSRGCAFDAAGNIYVTSGGSCTLRVYSPGLTSLCVTTNDATGTNGGFSLTYPAGFITVTADESLISQTNNYGNPTSGTFTISRTNNIGSPLTVNFSLGGTATNGATYSSSASGSVTIPAGQSSVQVTITAQNGFSAATTTVIFQLQPGAYNFNPPGSALMTILNTGPQVVDITSTPNPSFYRGISNDFATFIVSRYGDTNGTFSIPGGSFTYAGTATVGVDYAAIGNVTFNAGDVSKTVSVSGAMGAPTYVGTESVIIGLSAFAGCSAGPDTATLSLLDNRYQPAPILYQNPLTNSSDSTNWTLSFTTLGANGTNGTVISPLVIVGYQNNDTADYDVQFGYNLANDGVGPAPGGATNGLKVTCNKSAPGSTGGVSLYPTGQSFAYNYAVRFSMNLVRGSVNPTEYGQFGINHYGTNCNWWANDFVPGDNSTTNADGLWYSLSSDQGGAAFGDMLFFSANTNKLGNGSTFPNGGWTNIAKASEANFVSYFKHPSPYNAGGVSPLGSPACAAGNANTWSDVEIKQFNGVVTMSINKTPIFTYTNKTIFTNGDLMLGYCDPASTIGVGGAIYYSGLQVDALPPSIYTQPSNITAECGTNVVFSVNAIGIPPLTYQWYSPPAPLSDGGAISGSSTASLTLSGVQLAQSGSGYFVSVTDAYGSNVTSSTAVLTVHDTLPPVVSMNGPSTTNVECHTSFTDPGATANDFCVGALSPATNGSVNADAVGTYKITYSSTDPSGNVATPVVRTVTVVDTTPPVVTLNGPASVSLKTRLGYSDPGVTANDSCAGTLSATSSHNFNRNAAGTYVVTYSATDPSGNSGATTRTLDVTNAPDTNIWLNASSGKWEVEGNWSVGVPEPLDWTYITNTGAKTVTIDATTTGTYPYTMSVSNLFVGCTDGSGVNTLSLNNGGLLPALTVSGQFQLQSGGAMTVTNQTFVALGADVLVDGAILLQSGVLTLNRTLIGNTGQLSTNGSITMSNGIISMPELHIGYQTTGMVTVAGGFISNSVTTVGENAGASGALNITGGTNLVSSVLHAGTNGASGEISVLGGGLFVTNANGTALTLLDGASLLLGNGAFKSDNIVLTNGGTVISLSNYIVGSTAGTTNTANINNGALILTNSVLGIGNDGSTTNGSGTGITTVSNSTVSAGGINIGSSAGGSGSLTLQSNAFVNVNSNMSVVSGSLVSTSSVVLTGGSLTASNTVQVGSTGSASMVISGGDHTIGQLQLGSTNDDGSGELILSGGSLKILKELDSNFVIVNGGDLDGSGASYNIANGHNSTANQTSGTGKWGSINVGYSPGFTGVYNQSGGSVVVYTNMIVGDCVNGAVGQVNLTGGTLYITNATHTAVLDVRSGTFMMSAGATLVVDTIIVTNSCAYFIKQGGTLVQNNPPVLSANLDADIDQFPNWEEALAGTDPFDPNSNLSFTSITTTNLHDILLEWQAVGGHSYVIQTNADLLNGVFRDMTADIPVGGTNMTTASYLHTGGATKANLYYRIRLGP